MKIRWQDGKICHYLLNYQPMIPRIGDLIARPGGIHMGIILFVKRCEAIPSRFEVGFLHPDSTCHTFSSDVQSYVTYFVAR